VSTAVSESLYRALTGYVTGCLPEALLVAVACLMFLGGTWRRDRRLWGAVALAALAAAAALVAWKPLSRFDSAEDARAALYAAPVVYDNLALLFRALSLAGAAVLVLCNWDEVPDDQAADYHACVLIIAAGLCLTGAANELVTLFLALELVSIPTYVLLYLPRSDPAAQEAAMKYFLLSVFSSAFLLFGFSYLYGLAGTTNLPALADALARGRQAAAAQGAAGPGLALVALVMIVAGLGFRITAVPFHFYAPDVYQGTSTGNAALLAFVTKVAGFAALIRVLGFVPNEAAPAGAGQILGPQVPVLFWIIAAVTMSLGNVLALLQDNVKRLLAYSSVAHAGYMLIGLAVAGALGPAGSEPRPPVGAVGAVLFYLVAYGAMTVGAFAVLSALSTPARPVETVDDLAGLGRSRPGLALLMALFLFSLIGIPPTAGFAGKLLVFSGPFELPFGDDPAELQQRRLYILLVVIGVLNAAVGGYYYLRIAATMFLREPIQPVERPRAWPVLAAVGACALVTLAVGVYPEPLRRATEAAARPAPAERPVAAARP
jgi:NADH-quinone oxidoreductase subunit N